MKVKLLTTMAGPEGVILAGQIADLDDARARELIARGYAEAVAEAKLAAPEKATREPEEKAIRPSPKGKSSGKKPTPKAE